MILCIVIIVALVAIVWYAAGRYQPDPFAGYDDEDDLEGDEDPEPAAIPTVVIVVAPESGVPEKADDHEHFSDIH